MPFDFQRYRTGQPFRVTQRTANAMVAAAEAFERHALDPGQPPPAPAEDLRWMYVLNSSGGDRGRFEVLGIDSPVIDQAANADEFYNRPALVGVSPVESEHDNRFCVTIEPIAAGAIGRACVFGVVPVKINDATGTLVKIAGPSSSTFTSLTGGKTGADVLWRAAGSGEQWALVRLHGHGPATGVPYSGATADLDLGIHGLILGTYSGTPGNSTLYVTGGNLTWRDGSGTAHTIDGTAWVPYSGATGDVDLGSHAIAAAAATIAAGGSPTLTIQPTGVGEHPWTVVGTNADFSVIYNAGTPAIHVHALGNHVGINTTAPAAMLHTVETTNLSTAPGDDRAAGIILEPIYAGGGGVVLSRHNYLRLKNPAVSGGMFLTDACALEFDAAIGSHKALDSGTTKGSPGTVDGWLKVNVNGTVAYIPIYGSKTT